MQNREGQFNGYKNLKIYFQYWLPEDTPRAVLLIAHGFSEHSGHYGTVVDYFIPKGYAVWALDHRGHGRSEGERVQIDDFHDYIADLKTFFDIVRQNNPGKKIFLIGHSMGSMISLSYTLAYQNEMDGLITSGGGLAKPGVPPVLLISPGQTIDPATNCRNAKAVAEFVNDPLVYHGPVPPKHAILAGKRISELAHEVHQIRLPVLVMAGAGGPDGEASKVLFDLIGSKDKTHKAYPGLLHDIFKEPEYLQVLADLEEWVKAHT
jgi:acylglycerol lipase